jgi:uncharacterized paraquat-inducible protein A
MNLELAFPPSSPQRFPPADTLDGVQLANYLRDRDAPCPTCGYNLRGLQGGVCPECHEPLRLQVGAVEPKLAAYLTSIVLLSAGVGFSLLLVAYIGIMILINSLMPGTRAGVIFIGCVLPGAIELGLLLLLLRHRRWFRSRTKAHRWWIAAACGLATLGNVVLFSMIVN